jgi:hypothetical protein
MMARAAAAVNRNMSLRLFKVVKKVGAVLFYGKRKAAKAAFRFWI